MLHPRFLLSLPLLLVVVTTAASSAPVPDLINPPYAALPQAASIAARAGQDLEALMQEFWARYNEWKAIKEEIDEIGIEKFPYVNDVTRRTIRELMAQTSGAVQRAIEAAQKVNKARVAAGMQPMDITALL